MKRDRFLFLIVGVVIGFCLTRVVSPDQSGRSIVPPVSAAPLPGNTPAERASVNGEKELLFSPNVSEDPEGSQWVRKTARVSGSASAEMRNMHIVQRAALIAVQATERFCRERKQDYKMVDASLAVQSDNFLFEFTFEELEPVRPH